MANEGFCITFNAINVFNVITCLTIIYTVFAKSLFSHK